LTAGRTHLDDRSAVLSQHRSAVDTASTGAEIFVEGRVQGVGFRDYARRRASRLGLGGYVSNLRDGRVRLRVEGPRDSIETLLQDLQKGPPLARVERVSTRWMPATRRFTDFTIRESAFEA
jgi:acylphosphatase